MALTDSAAGLLSFSQRQLDRVAPPQARQNAWISVQRFARARPLLATFLTIQVVFSFLPLMLFASFVASAFLFALGTAALFTLFWVGVALLVLVPTLIVTISIALGVWIWGVVTFLTLRWLYDLLPGNVKGEMGKSGTAGKGGDRKLVVHVKRPETPVAPVVGVEVNRDHEKAL